MFHAQTLLHGLVGLRFAHPIYLYQQIGSTNDEAKVLAEAGAPEGLLIVAEQQTAGRGRAGRTWQTPAGTQVAFSLVLRPDLPARLATRVVMLAGLAACEAVEQITGLRADLKWPNDVLLGGRKVAGILVESAFRDDRLAYAVLGLGLNVSWAPAPEEADFAATSLEAEARRAVDRLKLLRALLAALEVRYPALADPALVADWQARLTLLHTPIVVQADDRQVAGRATGVTPEGALIVQANDGETHQFLAGDVKLRAA